jgi:hypothetical protein
MRRSPAKFSELEASNHTPSLADFITTTPVLKLSVHTGGCADGRRRQRRAARLRARHSLTEGLTATLQRALSCNQSELAEFTGYE